MAYQQDDSIHTWPEVFAAGTAAFGLYSRCGAYCADNSTDGHIPAGVAASYGTPEWARKLVEVGLWKVEGSGYWDVYFLVTKDGAKLNATREEALARKEAARERTRRWREGSQNRAGKGKKPQVKGNKSGDASRDGSRDANVDVTNGIRDASGDASPSLPSSKEEKGRARPASQGDARSSLTSPPAPEGQEQDHRTLIAQARAKAADASRKIHHTGNHRELDAMAALTAAVAEVLPTASTKETQA